jgi:type IV secretory pathway ATPase VirB11/archaellum biosynthesis ATPase
MGSEGSREAGSAEAASSDDGLSVSQHRDHDQSEDISSSSYSGDYLMRQRNERIRAMDEQIRSRVRHGIQYNLKFIIRGGKRSGKTTLWNRLQGFKFFSEVRRCSTLRSFMT